MYSALIGHTGFVGGNLRSQKDFTDLYNSKNIQDIRGKSYDLVVCAGVNAVKWMANKDPETDWQGIQDLLENLKDVQAERFVLISTVDVYPQISDVDEDTTIDSAANHAYGRHRYSVEEFVRENFSRHHVVRLPGLFGDGLKKNAIYDLINDNCLEMINPACSFQYYPLDRIWADVRKAIDFDLRLVNFATEPVATKDILAEFFAGKADMIGAEAGKEMHYDIRSRHFDLFGGSSGYILNQNEVMVAMGKFIKSFDRATP